MEQLRTYLHEVVDQLDESNIRSTRDTLVSILSWVDEGVKRNYFDILDGSALATSETSAAEEPVEDEPEAPTISMELMPEPTEEETAEDNVYPFNRRLRGGYLQELSAYVPEYFVRSNNLTEGDRLRATPKGEEEDKIYGGMRTVYDYEVVERTEADDNTDRVQHDYVMATLAFNQFQVIDPQSREPITYKGTDDPIMIPKDKFREHPHEVDGAIISIAYYENKPHTLRVIWRHNDQIDESPSPQKKSYYQTDTTGDGKETSDVLDGYTIGVATTDRSSHWHEDAFQRHGGTMIRMHPDEPATATESTLRKCDAAIVCIDYMSHNKSQEVFSYCKDNHIPCTSISNSGTSGILMKAKELVGTT